MKKISFFAAIAFLFLLAAIAIYIYRSKSELSTVNEDSRSFKIKDTASITKIFMADKEGRSALLEKKKDGWFVNGKHKCRSEAIFNLMEAIRHIEVKTPVPKEAKENVIRFMSANAIKVEIYAGNELIKQYYVGHETYDSEASYMILTNLCTGKNYKDPFACFIPGFRGFLQPRFITVENEWRDRLVINYIPPQIKQIKVLHMGTSPDSSFAIHLLNENKFRLINERGADVAFDEQAIRQYLIYFQNLSYEILITGKNKKLQDSLSTQTPFCVVSVVTSDNKKSDYKFYRKQFNGGNASPEFGVKFDYDPDRLYLRFNNDKEWALGQYFVFGKIMITTSYFISKPSVKK